MAKGAAREGYRRKHRSLVDDVADHANIRRDVVEEVLNSFYDIAAERIINERKFIIPGILSIGTIVTKNGIRPEPHLQYRAKVALGLRKLLQRIEKSPTLVVDRDNWKEAAALSTDKPSATPSMSLSDFLEEDE